MKFFCLSVYGGVGWLGLRMWGGGGVARMEKMI